MDGWLCLDLCLQNKNPSVFQGTAEKSAQLPVPPDASEEEFGFSNDDCKGERCS